MRGDVTIFYQYHARASQHYQAAGYHNLGGLEHARGRFAEGEPFAHKSVELRRLTHNDDHPDVAADSASRPKGQK